MPVGYGGGVASADEARRITGIGIEKVVLNTAAVERPETITEISDALGASSTVVSVDAKKKLTGGWDTYIRAGREDRHDAGRGGGPGAASSAPARSWCRRSTVRAPSAGTT